MWFAIVGVVSLLAAQSASASIRTPIHFIYVKAGATYQQFQNDRDACHRGAVKSRWYPLGMGSGNWAVNEQGSSTAFLNCMAEKGYTLAKSGWDTGVLWVLPYRPTNWHRAGWHMVEPAGLITSGPFSSKEACRTALPAGSHVLRCVWLDRAPN